MVLSAHRCHDNRCNRHDDNRLQLKHLKKGSKSKSSTGVASAQEPLPPLSLMSASAVEPSCLTSSDCQLDIKPESADVEMTEEEKKQLEFQRSHGAIPKRRPPAPG